MAGAWSVKGAIGAAVLGIGLIAAAGIATAVDNVKDTKPITCQAAQTAAASAVPKILSVSSGGAGKGAVLQLERPLCVIVAGLRSDPKLVELKAAVEASEKGVQDTDTQLQQARDALAAATGDAHKVAQQKVDDLKSALTDRKTALTERQATLDALSQDIDLALYVDGKETPAHAVVAGTSDAQAVLFTLEPTSDASSEDAGRLRQLLGGLTSGGERNVELGVGLRTGSRPLATWDPRQSHSDPVKLRVYSAPVAWTAGAGFVLLFLSIIFAGTGTGLLRDGNEPTSAYSLGRTQMAFWMITTLFGFVFIWVLTGQYRNVITEASFTLLGITGATALAARAIDGNAPASGTKNFVVDILSDGTGEPKLHRIQLVLWTLVLGVIYVWNIVNSLVLTDFDANLLILVGIANGVYAGFKTQEPVVAATANVPNKPTP